jgi:hypothetical protein
LSGKEMILLSVLMENGLDLIALPSMSQHYACLSLLAT